jgi:hypothetical protein
MVVKIIIGMLIVVLISLAIFFFLKHQREKEPIILGQQFADAVTKEQERLKSKPDIPSLMPEKHYKRQKGQWDLLNIEPAELDTGLQELCANFVGKPKSEQEKLRSAISLDEFYTLIEFARRSSVFALRDKDSDILNSALISIAMIEAERTDFRDILATLALIHHSAKRIGLDPSSMFLNFAKIAEPGTSELISGFVGRDSASQNLRESWGYYEVNTKYGAGFVSWGFEEYNPELDLLSIAMEIASAIEKDSYFVETIELATDLPSVWLEAPENKNLQQTLQKIIGGATVTCRLEDDKHPEAGNQQFTLFITELDSKESAQTLIEMSKKKKPQNYSMLGFSGGRLFVLLIARSVMVGVESFETRESLERFIKPINQIIQEIVP